VDGEDGELELKSMAVAEERRGDGVGRTLVEAALARCRDRGVHRITVSTASADTGNLRFYQRQGFRLLKVDRDVFGPEAGYPEGIVIDGIPLRDRVWLDQEL
jgi:ribosomal protein S18 acetylase RimI-like enzyme